MQLRTLFVTTLALAALALPAQAAPKPRTFDLWPGKAPGETAALPAEGLLEQKPNEKQVKRLANVSTPTLTVYRPDKEKDTGASVVIAPGGGYYILAMDLEGEEVAQWLNSIGVTGIVLKYRVPRRPGTPNEQPPLGALQDAQRAISTVRSKASEWGLDPKRIGMLGFSAGGHLTAWTSTNADKRAYEAVDSTDQASCRPDFSVLVYPAYLTGKEPNSLAPEIRVSDTTPPAFFAHAGDDPISAENSICMYQALKARKIPADLHIYHSGGHGFGLRPSEHPSSNWPKRCEEWMRAMGWLKKQ